MDEIEARKEIAELLEVQRIDRKIVLGVIGLLMAGIVVLLFLVGDLYKQFNGQVEMFKEKCPAMASPGIPWSPLFPSNASEPGNTLVTAFGMPFDSLPKPMNVSRVETKSFGG